MSVPLYYYVLGYRTLSTDASHAAELLELCRRSSWAYGNFSTDSCGALFLSFLLPLSREVERRAAAAEIPLSCVREGGLPRHLVRLVRRPGLLAGLLAGILLYVAASFVVWDIRISGNESVSDRAVEDTLAACGFTVGTSLRGLHMDEIENRVLLCDDRLAWISINRRGTVAYVEVREAVHQPPPASDSPADIVASEGGIIERVELSSGNVRVMAGDTVSPGDVLVSGLYDSDRYGVLYTRAEARVYARTARMLTVTIPLSYEQKVYEGENGETFSDMDQEKSLIFFGRHIKFSKKTGNSGIVCDTIEKEVLLSPLSGVGFPLSVRTVYYLPYTVKTATRTYAEAEELAYVELARRISALGDVELLQKTVSISRTPDALILSCALVCVEDIAATREIEVVETP